jgi:biopolymer transport protein ExbD
MAEKKRFLDVWIVEANTVYKEVPYTVVLDWIQQGRLLDEDQVRPSGTRDWQRLGGVTGLAAYLPKPEPMRANDQAEALEPVEMDFHWKKAPPDEDDEVDMIPLIDVSMVLLVFFMLTASSAGAAAFINMPQAGNAPIANTSGIWIGVNLEGEGKNRNLVYSLGEDGRPSPDDADRGLTSRTEMLKRFDALLSQKTAPVEVTVNAHKDVEDGQVLDVIKELSKPPRAAKIKAKYIGVSEKTP